MTAMPGRFFEDFEVGDTYRSRLGRTVTDTDNAWFTLLTNNTNQLHFNEHYAALTEFGRPLVNSALTIAIVAGLGVADTSENGFALGWDEITLPNPLYAGDTLYSESTVVRKRETKSRPEAGIVAFRTRGIKQTGHIVLDYTRSVMVFKRGQAPVVDAFPEPLIGSDDSPVRDRG
jgi:acyl dehydratase